MKAPYESLIKTFRNSGVNVASYFFFFICQKLSGNADLFKHAKEGNYKLSL